jgi:hypothetical protein
MRRYLLLCLSVANLCFLPSWLELMRFRSEAPHQMRSAAAVALFSGTVANILLLTAVLAGAVWFIQRSANKTLLRVAECGFLILLLTPLEELAWLGYSRLRGQLPDFVLVSAWSLAMAVPLAASVFLLVNGRKNFLRMAGVIVTLAVPVLPVFMIDFGRAYWSAPDYPEGPRQTRAAAVRPPVRLIWMIFDELDQRLVFEQRPASIQLPELDRLRATSFFAKDARPAGPDTPEAILSLLLGRKVASFDRSSVKPVVFATNERASLGELETSFIRLGASGIRSSVAGWFLPYCEAFGKTLETCDEPSPAALHSSSIAETMLSQWRNHRDGHWLVTRFSAEGQYRTPWFGWAKRREQLEGYRYLLKSGIAAATEPSNGLVLLHLPVPHPHGIYNRYRDELSLDRGNSYIDNLELVDRTIADIRSALGKAGLTGHTILIVTSDHPWRPEIWSHDSAFTAEERALGAGGRTNRIPFLVHLPQSSAPFEYVPPLDVLATGDLIGELLNGKADSAAAIAAWFERRQGPNSQPVLTSASGPAH